MKTIYVVQNLDDDPIMAFHDKETAEYVAGTNDGVCSSVNAVTLFEYDVATNDQVEGNIR